jgi:TrmH family RNA methyltransferase
MKSMPERITSLQNQRIRNVQLLDKPRERQRQQSFVLEGIKEIEKARRAGYAFKEAYYCPELLPADQAEALLGTAAGAVFEVSRPVYEKIAYRDSTEGMVVVAQPRSHRLEDFRLPERPLLLVLEGVEKPGNLGAMLRTADGAGADAVVVCDPHTDVYNRNAIRASLGCVFTVPVLVADTPAAIDWLQRHGIAVFATYLEAAKGYHEVDYTQPCAIVMGTEATGITPAWVQAARQNVIIPMQGVADSLNVSTAAAVVLFEARRQRGFN